MQPYEQEINRRDEKHMHHIDLLYIQLSPKYSRFFFDILMLNGGTAFRINRIRNCEKGIHGCI
jgi:hypothetical protein